MEPNKIGYWLQVGANVGILAGLILVGLQMRQNFDLLRLQLLKDESASYISTENAILGDNYADVYAKAINDPLNMTIAEMRVEDTMLWSHSLFRWSNTYRLYELGLVEAKEWKREIVRDSGFFFSTPYGRAWLDTISEDINAINQDPGQEAFVPQELLEYLHQHILKNVPVRQTNPYFTRTKENLRKYVPADAP